MEIIQRILNLGAAVVVPIIIIIIGLVVGMKLIKAVRAGVTVGVGFTGLMLITGLISTYMNPIIEALQKNWHMSLDTYDMGWPVASGIAYSNGQFVSILFATIILANVLMLIFKWTNVLNVDIWNFWHFIEGGMWVYIVTGNLVLGAIAGTLYSIVIVFLGGKMAPKVAEFLGYPGVAITTQSFPLSYYICVGINKVIDKIPGINKIRFSLNDLNPKYAWLGEPLFLGLILGAALTFLAGLGWEQALTTAMGMAAVMYILPRMVKILMEGLSPLSNAAQKFMKKKFPGREMYVGMDLAVLLGDSEVITLAMIMIPLTLVFAMILPGNRILPFIDLTGITYWMVAPVMASITKDGKRNSFRALILGVITVVSMLYIASDVAPIMTEFAKGSGLVDTTSGPVSAFSAGAELFSYALTKISQIFF
ncbi:PTS transporter subunit IIC [Anaerofustis sp. HA2171]|uniref:PTS transporter subunit IIC n=1 Tax=Anaerofustis butyriciformans TaxID=3108533 RepID=UPI002E2ED680|nr:PTS transporter subunit IIC [Anaerofustis sp. HA2171]